MRKGVDMSVLIKGAKPPKNCWDCQLNVAITIHGAHCPYAERIVSQEEFNMHSGRHPNCPLGEVPTPHGDLVDRDEIEVDVWEDYDGLNYQLYGKTVIEAEGDDYE